MKGFSHLVEMHKKYAKDGLVIITCSLDEPEKGVEERVRKILKQHNLTTTNLLLDEEMELWQERLHALSYPIIFVFNRKGRWKQFKDTIDYDKIEQTVKEFLKAKWGPTSGNSHSKRISEAQDQQNRK